MTTKLPPVSLYFNFHDFVQIHVSSDHPAATSFFAEEYRYHETDHLEKDIPTLYLVFHRDKKNFYRSTGHNSTKHTHKLVANWQYKLSIQPDTIQIDIYGNRISIPLVHHMLLHPSLRYLCAYKDVLMLHAGAVAFDGLSFIITGQGGAGKTTTTSSLLVEGDKHWRIHADDYVFLKPASTSLCYITRSHLYLGLDLWIPEVYTRLMLSEKLQLYVLGYLRRITQEGIKLPVRLPMDRIWPDKEIQPQADIQALMLLSKNEFINEMHITPFCDDRLILQSLMDMNFYEARHFLNLVEKSHVLIDFKNWRNHWYSTESRLLKDILASIKVFQLEIPTRNSSYRETRKAFFQQFDSLIQQYSQGKSGKFTKE